MFAPRAHNKPWFGLVLLALALLGTTARSQPTGESGADSGQVPGQEAQSADWQQISDRNGIQVYRQLNEDDDLQTFRGVMRMKLKDEYAFVALLNDYSSYPKWLHFVDSAHEIKRNGPLRRYLRFTTDLPWPLRNREAVIRADVTQSGQGVHKSSMIYLTNQPDLLPANDDYVRFHYLKGVFGARRLGDQRIEAIYQLVIDPGGYIPSWLVNILMRDTPYFTLQKMRRIIHEDEYQNQYFDYVDLHGPGRPEDATPDPRAYKPPALRDETTTPDQQ